ncbi:MAG: hypothetical protein OQK98_02345 [Gammaproteobacteria bacterium]|nr:hypothetical protein [Gammaproteobacteria bacterium]
MSHDIWLIMIWISHVVKNVLLLVFMVSFILSTNAAFSDDVIDQDVIDKRPDVSDNRKDIEESKAVIEEIMSNKPFVFIIEEKVWNFEKTQEEPEINPDMAWLTGLVSFITMLIEALLWFVPVIVIFYLYRYREYWLNLIQGKKYKKDKTEIPETLFGLDIRQQSLPDDIENEAHLLWLKSQHREAVSLLYRGALASLFKQYRFDLAAGATEQDCIRQLEAGSPIINASNSETSQSVINKRTIQFKKLTDIWVSVAYAHRLPDDHLFEEVCNNWNQFFSKHGTED